MYYKKPTIYAALCLLIISCSFILWGCLHFEPITLPKPTGKFKVGRTVLYLIDKARDEQHSKSAQPRELLVQIFYPAQASISQTALYADPSALAVIKEDLSKMTNTPLEKLGYLDSLKSNSFENAHVDLEQKSYPIIIFSPGWGASTILYSSFLEDLASHGFIVAGINYPYVTNPVAFPDGRVIKGISQPKDPIKKKEMSIKEIKIWAQDIKFVIDELEKLNTNDSNTIFKNKLDTKHIGIFGHSFGGSVAVEACKSDQRCIAGADIEGKLYETSILNKPFMFIAAPHAQEVLQPMKYVAKESKNVDYFEIAGTNHGSFTDLYLIAKFDKDMLPALDTLKGIEITRKLLVDFFDKNLK